MSLTQRGGFQGREGGDGRREEEGVARGGRLLAFGPRNVVKRIVQRSAFGLVDACLRGERGENEQPVVSIQIARARKVDIILPGKGSSDPWRKTGLLKSS